ncbi:MAG: GxxExxY protein [Spirochaetales bacterium]|nr:GxxExxY protein [Spirochaetales bacterium]
MGEIVFKELSDRVVGLGIKVHKNLGAGLTEKIYERAFGIELENAGIPYVRQKAYPIYYDNKHIGTYIADLVIDDSMILELKSVSMLTPNMEAQLINYLRLSKIRLGYLMNFNGSRLVFRRFVCG